MKKHLLIATTLAAALLFANAPRAHAFSPFGLMATLASDSDADDMPGNADNAAQANAAVHDNNVADESEKSADAGTSIATAATAARETAAQAKYAAAREPAGQ